MRPCRCRGGDVNKGGVGTRTWGTTGATQAVPTVGCCACTSTRVHTGNALLASSGAKFEFQQNDSNSPAFGPVCDSGSFLEVYTHIVRSLRGSLSRGIRAT